VTDVTLRRAGAWLERRGRHYLDFETRGGLGVVYFEPALPRAAWPSYDAIANAAVVLVAELARAIPAVVAWHEEREDEVWILFRHKESPCA